MINKIVELYKPKEIVIERLNFKSPKLSKRLNRVLNNFGKGLITEKFQAIKEEFGVIATEINPAYTSQECSSCGYIAKNNRKSQEVFICEFCKMKKNSDVNDTSGKLAKQGKLSKIKSMIILINIFSRSSTKLKNIYLNKAFILDELLKKFIERHSNHNSLANILAKSNPYFRKMKQLK